MSEALTDGEIGANAAQARAARLLRRLPGPLALFVAALGAVMLGITISNGVQDPDFFWHLTTGELIARSGRVPTTDPFSFTWAGQPWTLHEWLSELAIYELISRAGDVATLFAFGLLPAAIFAVLAWILARHGVGVLAFGLAAMPASLVLVPYVTVRPQAISWLLLAALIGLLLALRPSRPAWALALIPFFVLWANLHGLWVIGLGVVAVYAIFTLVGRTPMSAAKGWMAAGSLGAIVATAVTPAGLAGILYPLRYVNAGDWGLANIREWQSPDFHEPAQLALLALIVLVALNAGRATPGWLKVLSWIGIAMSLLAVRNAPIAAILVMPTLALGAQDRIGSWRRRPAADGSPTTRLVRRAMEVTLALVVVVAALVITLPRSPGLEPDPDRFPVAGVDRLTSLMPAARTLAEYGWGGYVISRVHAAGGRVFIDGRNDMYDDSILEDYSAIRAAEDDWESKLDQYDVEAILLPPSAPLARGAVRDAGWCEAYADDRQVLLLRDSCPSS
jgi:hypothetical protein